MLLLLGNHSQDTQNNISYPEAFKPILPNKLASLVNVIPYNLRALGLNLVTHWGHFLGLIRESQSNFLAGFMSLYMELLSLNALEVDTKVYLWKHTEVRHYPRVGQQLGPCGKTISNQYYQLMVYIDVVIR